jgi:glutamate dehydrogenase
VRRDLLHLKWIDQRALDLAYRNPALSFLKAEVLLALCHLCHQVLVKQNPFAFNPDRLVQMIERNIEPAMAIAELLLDRFDPADPLDDSDFARRIDAITAEIDADVDLEDARALLHKMVQAVQAVYRTNVYIEGRYALSMRLDPQFMKSDDRAEVPFGVFFVHGRAFNGFHVRFRDIARGGIRAVRPRSTDQHARESERLFDEVYQLAFAQQLKNKDIPEGGSKAAILIEPNTRIERSVKAFVDAILDLITPDESARRFVVDRLGVQELLYLGPDENITPTMIEWIVERAKRRGYPTPTALMSSKPGAGINHKRYGVTSEGVTVFLEVALNSIGIDPRTQPFTVKLTGGPDGDVGGNMIRIMHRDFGDNARIVGIADGSGSAEDPDGLDHQELLRLFSIAAPVEHFDRSRLGPAGRVASLDDADGVMLRNTLHNRLVTDAFVPCGGRPNAIHGGNWKQFLKADGTPSSRIIVEGANLFLTPEAREELTACGVAILKDSSANKCGVICSSYEIISCMLLDEAEFLEIKDVFVEQVLEKLRGLARREAELLLRVHNHMPHLSLPRLSIRLSEVMMRTADAIAGALDHLPDHYRDVARQLVIDHLPSILLERAGDRVWTDLPTTYTHWMMAKSLAARIVYREGFEYLQSMAPGMIADLALRYLTLELERRSLCAEVQHSLLPSRHRIAVLLNAAGILSTIGEEAQHTVDPPKKCD